MVAWLASVDEGRSAYATEYLARTSKGMVVAGVGPASVEPLEPWLQRWVRRVLGRFYGSYWTYELPDGLPTFAQPHHPGYDPEVVAVQVSIAVDAALFVVNEARRDHPLTWTVSRETFGITDRRTGYDPPCHLPTLDPGSARVYPLSVTYHLLTLALARPGSAQEQRHTERYDAGETVLGALYAALVNGTYDSRLGGPL